MRAYFSTFALCSTLIAAAVSGCSDNTENPPTDGGADQGNTSSDGKLASGPRLVGTLKDARDEPIGDATVAIGDKTTLSGYDGRYSLEGLSAGAAEAKISAAWFASKTLSVTIAAEQETVLDTVLDALPLALESADVSLAETFATSYDPSTATAYVAVVTAPTRRQLDNAVHFQNPASYRDRSTEPALIPSPLPVVADGTGANFAFQVDGTDALVATTIVDSWAATGLPDTAALDFYSWAPALSWLKAKDAAEASGLNKLHNAVRLQNWGGNAVAPQAIEHAYLYDGQLWVKIVFEPFVALGEGISDSDGDGKKEVFAQVEAALLSSAAYDLLTGDYSAKRYDTLGLREQLAETLNDLYSTTNLTILQAIGEPYTLEGVGTFAYPFVVHQQMGLKGNKIIGVTLVNPGS